MKKTGVVCPDCGAKTDECPCWNCGHEFCLVDADGLTAEQWAEILFEFEDCEECGGGINDHDYILLMGHWFAKCKTRNRMFYMMM